MFSLYELGVLYGDGHFQLNNHFLFTTTEKEIAERIEKNLKEEKRKYSRHERKHSGEKEKWQTLHIIDISDKKLIKELKINGLYSLNPGLRLKNHPDFIRGYIETKGTIHSYVNRDTSTWRMAISGKKEDLEALLKILSPMISPKKIKQRKDRERLGIHSMSYRFCINKREEIKRVIDYIDAEKEISKKLKEKIKKFNEFYKKEPFNMNRVFRSVKYAVLAMAKVLEFEMHGVRGGDKSIYLWENDKKIKTFPGWEQAYFWIREVYREKTGKTPPEIKKENTSCSRNRE